MAQGRVVICDDDKANLLTMKKALEKVDFEIIDFNNPEEGMKFIQNNDNIDLVLTDLKMPKVTGIEILKSVKQKDPSIGVIL
ncbi:MAG: response regulator, partial [Acidobacteria bacterium]|nr:response regulator [Acidobacteriota bacterium]